MSDRNGGGNTEEEGEQWSETRVRRRKEGRKGRRGRGEEGCDSILSRHSCYEWAEKEHLKREEEERGDPESWKKKRARKCTLDIINSPTVSSSTFTSCSRSANIDRPTFTITVSSHT